MGLYMNVISFINLSVVQFHDLRCWVTFGWAIVGLLRSGKISLSHWALYRPGSSSAKNKEQQLSSWLHNGKIKPQLLYRPLAKVIVALWAEEKVHLVLDTTSLWNRFTIVYVALVYRGRALPLSWDVLSSCSTTIAYEVYAPLLEEVATILPSSCRAIFLADRGFVHVNLFKQLRRLCWSYAIRLKQDTKVYRIGKAGCPLSRLMPPKGQVRFYHRVSLTDARIGFVHLALGHVETVNGYEMWAIVSDTKTDLNTFSTYGLRFDIEEFILDQKSAGFQLESSQIDNAQALSRLILILAVATLYLVNMGTAVVEKDVRRLIDTHWQRGLSYFQLGWRWVERALALGDLLFEGLFLKPGPDPEPCFASNKQQQQAKILIYQIDLCH